jgi:preprotein translocase subunit SecA
MQMPDDELDVEIKRLESQGSGKNQPDTELAKDPNEMSDTELEAEIARLENLEKQGKSSDMPNNPFSSIDNKPIHVEKIGRNDPCPCGSGLKWKKCGLINSPQHKN